MPTPSKKTPTKKPRNAKPRVAKPHTPRGRRAAVPGWLLLIDNEPIRREAIAEYQRIEKDISVAREQVESFEAGDLPAYERWQAQLFGQLLTELRTALQAIQEKRALLIEIEEEMFWGRCNEITAYRRVMKRRQSPGADAERDADSEWQQQRDEEDFESEEDGMGGGGRLFGDSDLPPDFDIDEFDRMTAKKQKKFRNEYRMMSALFEMMTGQEAPDLEEVLQQERARRGRGTAAPQGERGLHESQRNQAVDRLKELYRKLVRQLHPDTAQELTERERELWHEVQEAYRTKDLERMEAVAGRVELGLGGNALNLSLQILRRMTRDLRDALHGLKLRISTVRKHPAWLFRKKTKELAKLEAKHRRALTKELREANEELASLTESLAEIEGEANAPRKRKRRKKSVDFFPDDLPF